MDWHIERLDSCASTMDEARQRARDGAPDGTLVVAKRMQAGRGRAGHAWHAPEGGWYGAFVVRDLADPHLLTLALGNAVADFLEVAGAEPRLKWVNDILVDDRKVAGVLVEAESTGDHIDFLVAGIGINLNGSTSAWPDGLDGIAVTLEDLLGVETCIEDVESFLLDSIDAWLERVRKGRDKEVLEAFGRRDALHGRRVRVDGVEGVAQGIDDAGRLLVDAQAVQAGTVQILD